MLKCPLKNLFQKWLLVLVSTVWYIVPLFTDVIFPLDPNISNFASFVSFTLLCCRSWPYSWPDEPIHRTVLKPQCSIVITFRLKELCSPSGPLVLVCLSFFILSWQSWWAFHCGNQSHLFKVSHRSLCGAPASLSPLHPAGNHQCRRTTRLMPSGWWSALCPSPVCLAAPCWSSIWRSWIPVCKHKLELQYIPGIHLTFEYYQRSRVVNMARHKIQPEERGCYDNFHPLHCPFDVFVIALHDLLWCLSNCSFSPVWNTSFKPSTQGASFTVAIQQSCPCLFRVCSLKDLAFKFNSSTFSFSVWKSYVNSFK